MITGHRQIKGCPLLCVWICVLVCVCVCVLQVSSQLQRRVCVCVHTTLQKGAAENKFHQVKWRYLIYTFKSFLKLLDNIK